MKKSFIQGGLFLGALLSFFSYSQELNNKSWQTHGFLSQGLINVNGTNFVTDNEGMSTDLTELGINASYQLNDVVRLTGQAVYLNGGNRFVEGARIDYALIDFSVFQNEHWLVNFYLGRYKNNNWLYSSTRDVPHARPSIILPQSVYFDGFRDIAMGSDGAALKISYSGEHIGDIDINVNYGASSLSRKDAKLLLGDSVSGKGEQEFDAQFSIYWQPEFSPWQFGFSLLDSDFNYQHVSTDMFTDAGFSFQQYTGNILYEGEKWQFSTEFFQQNFLLTGLYFDGFSKKSIGQGAYLQAQYQYSSHLSLLARAERFYVDKDDKNGSQLAAGSFGLVPHYFAYQNDLTFGVYYDINASLRLQMEYHHIAGTARLTPIVMPDAQRNDQEDWNILAMQLMYWF
ncbi:hypothetical protein [Thalassotalea sp. G2M2-11]|uniref:hypothetical protein n=1 Tax=Thalassotalea sp. G2M2-11 TaxID=2787627 RepID=UPI0019D18CD6|nr:hypothetical protein [Thalassotalea sp. G2M2-11]